jgi:short-subunit dehydrogenase
MISLQGRIIWIVGASTGIGEGLALELARRGARVAVSSRRVELLTTLVERIRGAGAQAEAFPLDVMNLAEVKSSRARIEEALGPIDIVISNAGNHIPSRPLKFDAAEYRSVMDLNYGGMLHVLEATLPAMIDRKRGRFVGVASLTGYRGLPSAEAYGASKAAMINFLEALRFQMVEVGVGVTIVNPGFVKTPLTDKNNFAMPFLIDTARAARIICDGLEREKKEIAFPFPFNLFLKIGRISPYPIYEWCVGQIWKRMPRE